MAEDNPTKAARSIERIFMKRGALLRLTDFDADAISLRIQG
jgi:hypothetical protein